MRRAVTVWGVLAAVVLCASASAALSRDGSGGPSVKLSVTAQLFHAEMFLGPGLAAVSCPTVSACVAVGESAPRSGPRSVLAERWTGARWSVVRVARPSRTAVSLLNGLSCPSAGACVAVGSMYPPDRIAPVAEAWHNGRWSIEKAVMPRGARDASLDDVSCVSWHACIAVGDWYHELSGSAETLAERWNGRHWSVLPTPRPSRSQASLLSGVSCTSSIACTAVGNALPRSGNPFTLVERWDGRRWSIERSPNPLGYAELEGVSCPSRMTCTAVGIAWRPDYSRTTIAERWNAGAWMTVPLPGLGPGSDAGLDGVSCTSASACTAVGWGFSDSAGPALVERWNGTRWSLQPTPATPGDAELQGVSCPTLTACTAVGIGAPTIAERWDGMRWAISR